MTRLPTPQFSDSGVPYFILGPILTLFNNKTLRPELLALFFSVLLTVRYTEDKKKAAV